MTGSRILVFFSLFATLGSAANLTLRDLKNQLARRGATWSAGETSVSRFSEQEKKNLLGMQLDEGFGDVFKSKNPVQNRALPSKFDWRNKDGVNYASPMLNQANCGSCVAFSAIGALETQMNITNNTPHSPWAFSPQHLFACGGGACQNGWHPMMAVQFMQKTGVPDESCFPYTSGGDGKDLACSQTCSDASKRSIKITGYSQPSFFFQDQNAVKEALMKGPLMTSMLVYEDFIFYKSGVYKHTTGSQLGGHAITMMGWDDSAKAWIVRNSWGEDWGEKGYFRIAYDDASGLGNQTWGIEVPSTKGYVSLGGIRDHAVLSGVVSLNLESTINGTKDIDLTVNKNDEVVLWTSAKNRERVSIDTSKFPDGKYTISAVADTASGKVASQPRVVYVLNGTHQGSIELTNVTEGETLTEQKELQIKTTGKPVPFTSVTFKAVNLTTGEENVRSTYTVLPEMVMLWRAQYLKNGDYLVKAEAKVGDKVQVESKSYKVKINH
ncbi:MAG: C1 family peptidase [Pseudomonadota bacterium]